MLNKSVFAIVCAFSALFAQQTGARYLIITHDNYYNAIKPLAEWKTQKGCKAKIVRLSEIGSDSTQIKNYVVNAYNSWNIKPEFLLLVGNKYQLPFPVMGHTGYDYYCSDNYYTNVAGDFRNEIIPGRLWVFDSSQVNTIVAKILGYEKNPYLSDLSWFRKGTTIVNEDDYPPYSDSVYWADTRFAHELMAYANFVQIDSLAESFGNSSVDVVNAINEGRTYILYRGVSFHYWDFPFWDIDTSDMHNGLKLPVVISATCATVEGIGDAWLNAGTPDTPKGTIGFLGTTTGLENAAEYRSALAKGTMQAIFRDSLVTLGKAAEAGRLNYYNIFGNTLEYDSWTCLGDPELNLWTTTPRPIHILHTGFWVRDTYTVTVKYNSLPVESALICIQEFHDTTTYFYKRTDASGKAVFIGSLHMPDSALLTVTGRNLLPAIDTIIGGPVGCAFVTYYKHLILDTISGNGNFQPNNGEDIELAVWVLNIGDSIAHNVSGLLQKVEPDNYYQISDTIKIFGNIPPSDSSFTSENGFNITIHPDCPDSHSIKLKLTLLSASGDIWTSFFEFLVYSPRPYIILQSHSINDSLGGNNNHQINPGENIELAVWLQNIGDSMAENVSAVLRKQIYDSLFNIEDTLKFFGTILPQDSTSTGYDGYNILVDSTCPDLHDIGVQILIRDSLDSTWIYNFNLVNHAPNLIFGNYLFNDSLKYMLPADTTILKVSIKNAGSFFAENIVAHCISDDTLITIVTDSAFYGNIEPDSIATNNLMPFVMLASPQTPPCYTTNLKLALDGIRYHDTINFQIYVGQRDYFVWDPDPNHSSGFMIHLKLMNSHYVGNYSHTFPSDYLNIYKTLFVTCGIYPNTFKINNNSPVIPEILDFLNDGGRMYLEGGEVWHYDPLQGGYDFRPLFCISSLSNNIGLFNGVIGIAGTFTQSMDFNYSGETSSIDWVIPDTNGIAIFKNRPNNRGCGVAANHKTVGVSFEFGGLVDSLPPSTKLALLDSIMRYFDINPSGNIEEQTELQLIKGKTLEVYPNPFQNATNIEFAIRNPQSAISLKVYDATGRLVKDLTQLLNYQLPNNQVVWSGTDDLGRKVPAGVYFVQFEAGNAKQIEKVVLLR